MRARLRGPNGASTVTLADDAIVADLLKQITEKTSLPSFDVKYGYPPKPLDLSQTAHLIKDLEVNLDGEQLTISAKDDPKADTPPITSQSASSTPKENQSPALSDRKLISLKKEKMKADVPEIPFPERGATVVLRVMPDDNSCLFRAFAAAALPTGDDASMPELRALVAGMIQSQPEIYTKVVLEQDPDDYCRWIQTPDAWGGAIEMGILSSHFDIEICSIDVKSLRVDRFNEGATNRCILVYSGIHYDTIVQSPSEPPHTKANNPPELDLRIWPGDDDAILVKALDLCQVLQGKNYYTDTAGMAIQCQICHAVIYGQAQAQTHASQTGHYDMQEVKTASS